MILSYLPKLSYSESCFARIQHLLAHEKEQIQNFRNWVSSSSEGTSRSAPESPVIGKIEIPSASLPSVDTAEKPSEPSPKAPDHTPATAEGPPMLVGLEVVGLKGRKVLPFDWFPFSLCLSQPRKSWGKICSMILC